MNSPEHRALARAVGTVIENLGDDDVAFPDVVRKVRVEFPKACADVADAALDRLITAIAKHKIKPPDDDETASRLPGFDLPLRIPVATEGGFVWRHMTRCTIPEIQAHLELLKEQIKRDRARARVFEREMKRVIAVLTAADVPRLCDLPITTEETP
jgi:hypothetical protein